MVLKRYTGPRGRVEIVDHESELLRANPLGDPSRRRLGVYLPAGYDESDSRRYPVLFALAGFTGSGLALLNWKGFAENVPERLDRLVHEGRMGPTIVVFPDLFTALGGNQYINSSAVGAYADHIVEELVPYVDQQYRTLGGREHRGVFGKSSGGYGAMMHGMLYPDTWGAVACHSGDMYFEYAYRSAFGPLLDVLARHDHSVEKYLEHLRDRLKPSSDEIHALMGIAMAATYDPDPTAPLGFHLPFDLRTGEIDETRWRRWLRWDPVERVAEAAGNLARLGELFIDCGTRDQYHLHYGARILHRRLEAAGVGHTYQEFDDDHSSVDYRLDVSLPRLYAAIA